MLNLNSIDHMEPLRRRCGDATGALLHAAFDGGVYELVACKSTLFIGDVVSLWMSTSGSFMGPRNLSISEYRPIV